MLGMCAKIAIVTRIDSKVLGARIREARERAGLSQSQLAAEVSLDRTALNKVESGSRRVTALELADLAAAVGVRMARFFEDPPPALVSHRAHGGADTADSKIDERLATLAAEVEFIQSLGSNLMRAEAAPEGPWASPANGAEAEALAKKARTVLALDADDPARNLTKLVQRVGLWAFAFDLGADTADAGTVLLRHGGLALINGHNKVGRRRLALVHELGHFLVQDDYTIDWRVSDRPTGMEARLDRFARAVLLPPLALKKLWEKQHSERTLRERAVLVASHFQVDMATLARRVEELELEGDPDQIREVRTTRTDIVEHGLHPMPEELQAITLPEQYQRAVLSLYRQDRISTERALDLLHSTFDEADLPRHRTRSEGEFWQFVS